MCCAHIRIAQPDATSDYLTHNYDLHTRLTSMRYTNARPLTVRFTVTWKPVRAPVTTEEPEVAEPVRV